MYLKFQNSLKDVLSHCPSKLAQAMQYIDSLLLSRPKYQSSEKYTNVSTSVVMS